jgi:SAM-dependent methyltransferase
MPGYEICPDVTFTVRMGGVLASNHRARSHVWMSLPLFRHLVGDRNDGVLKAGNLTSFSNLDNHFAEPSGLDPHWDGKNVQEFGTLEEAEAYLEKHFILAGNTKAYREYFAKKRNILDRARMGNFHQRLGYQLFLEKRLSPETLWEDNKVDRLSGKLSGALYKYVQKPFLDEYFSAIDWKGKVAVDFGCGNGLVAAQLTKLGAEVIGVDPDKIRLDQARALAGPAFTSIWMDLASPDPLAVLPDIEVDFVWMSDVFIFYFYPVDACAPVARPAELLKRLTRNLKVGGRCVVMEPHGCFWLAPWLGGAEQPFTVLTEYSKKSYSVSPGLEEIAEAIAEAGLHIRRIYEPKPAEEGRTVDPRAYYFATNFPQWWVFEMIKPVQS